MLEDQWLSSCLSYCEVSAVCAAEAVGQPAAGCKMLVGECAESVNWRKRGKEFGFGGTYGIGTKVSKRRELCCGEGKGRVPSDGAGTGAIDDDTVGVSSEGRWSHTSGDNGAER